MNMIIRFLNDEKGATAIEYGLIAALVGVAIIAALDNFGNATGNMYNFIEDTIVSAG